MLYSYDVTYCDRKVGKVNIEKEGLYYKIVSDIDITDKGFYRLYYIMGADITDLGLCLPAFQGYRLRKTIAVKDFPIGNGYFHVRKNGEQDEEKFFVICETMPFPMLQELEMGKFGWKNGKPGIYF